MITIEPDLVFALGGAVMHFLWQGALIGLIAASILYGLRKGSAQARYTVACGALALCLVVFVATLICMLPRASSNAGALSISSVQSFAVTQEEASSLPWRGELAAESRWNLAEIAAWGWGFGVVFMLLRFTRHWLWSHRLRTRMVTDPDQKCLQVFEELKQELKISRAISLFKSGLAETPMVVGCFAPVILVPVGAFTSLSPEQLRMILVHELAHIRRYDHWINQFQGAIEIILFFHPAMWWISRQVRVEREYCCDDASLRGTSAPKVLAEALTQLELLRVSSPTNSLAANGGSLMSRITRILSNKKNQTEEYKMKIQTLSIMAVGVLLIGGISILSAQDKIIGEHKWQVKTAGLKVPAGWEPFGYDSNDEFDPVLLRRSSSAQWDAKQKWEINTAGFKIPAGWEPFGYDGNDEFDPVLLRRSSSANWDPKQKWEIKTAGLKIPIGWEPFAYDSKDQSDPFLLRRCTTGNWDNKQKWEVTTSNGLNIPAGWEPFGYDWNDKFDPFLLRRCTTGNWDPKQKWEIKTAGLKIPVGWEPFAYDSKDQFDPFLLRQRVK